MEHTSSFTRGLNKDTAKHLYSPENYYHLENFRLMLGDNNESGALANVEGNLLITNIEEFIFDYFKITYHSSIESRTNARVIGYATVLETIYLFCILEEEEASSIIVRVVIDGLEATLSMVWHDRNMPDKLGLSSAYPIRRTIGVPESKYVHSVYFTDFYNPFRKINVMKTDLLDYQGSGNPMPSYMMDIVPDAKLDNPVITKVYSGGSLTAGMVQYAYSLYNINGQETKFSALSNLVHLVADNDYMSNSEQYYGSEIGTNTGKAVSLSITNADSNYSNIRVVSIHYSELYTEPTISIVAEVKRLDNNIIIDDGVDMLGSYTVDEFTALGGTLFTCKDFEAKDNRLYAANITEKYYDLDFDARAYRFPAGNSTTSIFNSLGNSTTVSTSPGSFDAVPETHDCINPFNVVINPNSTLKYKVGLGNNLIDNSNSLNIGNVLGGTGKNVSYEFIKKRVIEDELSNQTFTVIPSNADARTTRAPGQANTSYTNYASPYNNVYKSHQRDEIYSYGLVFVNKKGIPSFVKWIGDIRFPSTKEAPLTYIDYNQSASEHPLYINILGIRFTISNLSQEIREEIQGIHVVRCKREGNDRTVLMQGMFSTYKLNSYLFVPEHVHYLTGISPSAQRLGDFISPEVCFNKTTASSGDYLEFIGEYGVVGTDTPSLATNHHAKHAITANTSSLSPVLIDESRIDTNVPGSLSLSNVDYKNYHDAGQTSIKGTSLTILLDSEVKAKTFQVNVRKNIIPYIGNTYAARVNREYFSVCYIPVTSINNVGTVTVDVYNGDTYISVFDYLRSARNVDTHGDMINVFYLFPVETSINLNLRHDTCAHRVYDVSKYWLMQEEKNKGLADFPSDYPASFTDLYLYNSVYSRENDLVKFFPKPLDWVDPKEFVTDTIYSEVKQYGEEIDSWCKFLPNSRNQANSQYGPINKILLHNNQLLFLQDRAVGAWYTNIQELITTNNPGALAVGTGSVLQKYDYLTVTSGTKHQFSVINTPGSLYYLDEYNGTINKIGNGISSLSVDKAVASFVKSYIDTRGDNPITDPTMGVTTAYAKEYGELYFTFRKLEGSSTKSMTIVYSEVLDTFVSIYTVAPRLYMVTPNYLLTVPDTLDKIYMNNVGNYGQWFDTYYPSTITMLVNPAAGKNCLFTKATFNTECSQDEETFTSVEGWNNYQSSVVTNLVMEDNLDRKLRTWRLALPRDKDEETVLRDNHLFLKLSYTNSDNKKFLVYPVTTHFNMSPF